MIFNTIRNIIKNDPYSLENTRKILEEDDTSLRPFLAYYNAISDMLNIIQDRCTYLM